MEGNGAVELGLGLGFGYGLGYADADADAMLKLQYADMDDMIWIVMRNSRVSSE